MATNDDTIAARSENLVRMYPCEPLLCRHISVSATRRLLIQFRPTHTATLKPMMPTDARASIAEFIRSSIC